MKMNSSFEFAQLMDAEDPLYKMREHFILPRNETYPQIYLLGNSLGCQPKNAAVYIQDVLNQWAEDGVESFFKGNNPWMDYHAHLQQPIAKIVGALPEEITVMNQLTVNLHLMLVSFYQPNGKKRKILCEQKAFPSDQYTLETYIRHLGLDPEEIIMEIGPRVGEETIRTEDIVSYINQHHEEITLVFWGGINYYTGQLFDMAAITKAAQQNNIKVGFDLAHAAGNVALRLHEWNVDFACWCGYKYLNGGPGAVAGCFIHKRYHEDAQINRLAGWWGYEKATRFKMEKGFKPVPTAEGWQLSTPSLLLYACAKAALDIFELAGWKNILSKQEKMKTYIWFLLQQLSESKTDKPFSILTPELERGNQISMLVLQNGRMVYDALMREGITVDWREPNVIRFAPAPLYNSFEDIWRLVDAIKRAIHLTKNS
ncbi:MAG: kynureninase [Chitinophagaceae bacterium]|nr:kynureninase [Chitinophagaceae bacterium]